MSRRSKGQGSVRWRADLGVYEIRLTVGGKRRSWYSPGPRNRANQRRAEEKRRRLALAHALGELQDEAGPTLEEWLWAHLEFLEDEGRRPNSLANYRNYIKKITAYMGGARLGELTTERIEAFYRELARKGYSRSVIQHVHNFLKQALRRAVRYGRLKANPASEAVLPKVEPREVGREVMVEELDRILAAARGTRYYAAIYLAAALGLRRGELLGLMWPDVDFETATLRIRRAVVKNTLARGRAEIGATKTSGSIRDLPLLPDVVDVLLEHRVSLMAEGLYHPDGLVFPSERGTPINPDNFRRAWVRILKKAEVEGIRLHDLRSTFITRVIRETRNPKLAAVLAGHRNLNTALAYYTRVSEEDLRKAMREIHSKERYPLTTPKVARE